MFGLICLPRIGGTCFWPAPSRGSAQFTIPSGLQHDVALRLDGDLRALDLDLAVALSTIDALGSAARRCPVMALPSEQGEVVAGCDADPAAGISVRGP